MSQIHPSITDFLTDINNRIKCFNELNNNANQIKAGHNLHFAKATETNNYSQCTSSF